MLLQLLVCGIIFMCLSIGTVQSMELLSSSVAFRPSSQLVASVAKPDHDVSREILDIEQITDESMGLELTEDNIDDVLDEIRPYLVGESRRRVSTTFLCLSHCCFDAGPAGLIHASKSRSCTTA